MLSLSLTLAISRSYQPSLSILCLNKKRLAELSHLSSCSHI